MSTPPEGRWSPSKRNRPVGLRGGASPSGEPLSSDPSAHAVPSDGLPSRAHDFVDVEEEENRRDEDRLAGSVVGGPPAVGGAPPSDPSADAVPSDGLPSAPTISWTSRRRKTVETRIAWPDLSSEALPPALRRGREIFARYVMSTTR